MTAEPDGPACAASVDGVVGPLREAHAPVTDGVTDVRT